MKNLILAALTTLAGLSINTQKSNKHRGCECSSCFVKNNKNIRFNRRKKEVKNTKSQENRKEEL